MFDDPQALAWALERADDSVDLSGYSDAFLGTAVGIASSHSWANAAYDLGYENARRRYATSPNLNPQNADAAGVEEGRPE